MSVSYFVVSFFFTTIAIFVANFLFNKWRKPSSSPPIVGELIPIMGCGYSFGKDPIQFLKSTRSKFGDVFTLLVPGRKITFLMQPNDFDVYFNSAEEAVQPFTNRIFGIEKKAFLDFHLQFLTTIRNELAPTKLEKHVLLLGSLFQQKFNEWDSKGKIDDLAEKIRTTIFWCAIESVYTKSFASENPHLYQQLVDLDESFEIASSIVPHFLLRSFSKARNELRSSLQKYTTDFHKEKNKPEFKAVSHTMMELFNDDKIPVNFLFALLWALQTNSLNIAFWTVYHIITSNYKTSVYEELKRVVGNSDVTINHLKECELLHWSVMEAIRLHSMGMIIRKVKKPLHYNGYIIPAGNDLCISPYLTHTDPSIYSEPNVFRPERFSPQFEEHKKLRYGYVPFGAGTYRCPGQHFAILEIELFIAMFLLQFELNPKENIYPSHIKHRIVGVQFPEKPFPVQFSKRNK